MVCKLKIELHAPEVTSLKHKNLINRHLKELKQNSKKAYGDVAIIRSAMGWILFKLEAKYFSDI